MAQYVYPHATSILQDADGISWTVIANTPWDASDPLVRRHPSFFSPKPSQVGRTRQPVEQATRSPGEVRPHRVG